MIPPHVLKQHRSCNHLSGTAQKVFQKVEFTRKELNFRAGAINRSFDQVYFEIADLQVGRTHSVKTAEQPFNARTKLSHREWFREIVVSSGFQAANLLING